MEITISFAILVPIVIGLVQVARITGLPVQFAPLFAILVGIAGAGLIGGANPSSIIYGIVAGLTSMGLYSGSRTTVGK